MLGSPSIHYRGGSLDFELYQDIGNVAITWKTGLKSTFGDYEFGNRSDANIWTYNGPLTNAEFLRAVQSTNDWHPGASGMRVQTLGGGDCVASDAKRP